MKCKCMKCFIFLVLKISSSKLLIQWQNLFWGKKSETKKYLLYDSIYIELQGQAKLMQKKFWIMILVGAQIVVPLILHRMKTKAADADWQGYEHYEQQNWDLNSQTGAASSWLIFLDNTCLWSLLFIPGVRHEKQNKLILCPNWQQSTEGRNIPWNV